MSYCRINEEDSDVYLYMNMDEKLTCTCPRGLVTKDYILMYQHLEEHERVGLKVPKKAYDRMKNESTELCNYLTAVFDE